MRIASMILCLLQALLLGRAAVAAENLSLRQQLIGLQRSVKQPRLQKRDRNAPVQGRVERLEQGKAVASSQLGGLHHR